MNPEFQNSFAEFHVVEGVGYLMPTSDLRAAMAVDPDKKVAPPTNVVDVTNLGANPLLMPWGEDNLFPQRLRKACNTNSKMKVGLGLTAAQALAAGIQTGRVTDGQFRPEAFAPWDEWSRKALFHRQFSLLAARNLKQYYMAFVSLVLSRDGRQIAVARTIPAPKCRLSVPEGLDSAYCYLSAEWEAGARVGDTKKVKALPVVRSWHDPVGWMQEYLKKYPKAREFVYVLRIPTDEDVYPTPDYYAVIEQRWVDVSNDVPEFKRWWMKNASHVNYILYVADWYWAKRFPEWNDKLKSAKPEDRDWLVTQRKTEVGRIHTLMTDRKNAGKLLISDVNTGNDLRGDKITDDMRKAIRLETVQNGKIEGQYLADANEADTQILFALGLDPSTFGSAPGTQRQGGSDKRESHNISQVLNYEFETVFLEIPQFIRDFNGYPAEMEFRIQRSTLQTQDQITPAKRETGPAVETAEKTPPPAK